MEDDDYSAIPLQLFFGSPVTDLQQVCLDDAITIETDSRLEGFEGFYLDVDYSLTIPQQVYIDGGFSVVIEDDGIA